jgi:hypothetical protein
MTTASVSQNAQLTDPDILALGRRVAGELIMSAQKAAAHLAEPANFPLAADASDERLFVERLQALPAERRQHASARALEFIRGPADARARLVGDLADLDLRAPTAVRALARQKPRAALPLDAARLGNAFTRGITAATAAKPRLRPRDAHEWLELRVRHARCVDETNGLFGSEAGSDEIDIAAILVDGIQRTTKSPVLKLGDFASDGVQRGFDPPLVLGGFDLAAGFYWPRRLSAMVYLNEQDNGSFPAWLQKIFDAAKDKIVSLVKEAASAASAAAIGAVIGSAVGPIGTAIGALVGALIGWVLGEVIAAIKAIWEDDVFGSVTLDVDLPSADALFDGKTTSAPITLGYAGHGGYYEIQVDFRMTSRPGSERAPTLVTSVFEDFATDLAGIACCPAVRIQTTTTTYDPITKQKLTLPVAAALQKVPESLVFALGHADGSVMVRTIDGLADAWQSLGGGFHSGPAVAIASSNPTRPVVFGTGLDDAIWHAWRDASWSGWHGLGGVLTSAPAAVVAGNRLVVAARGADNAIWHRWYEDGWSDWHSLGGLATSAPAMLFADGRLSVYYRGEDGAIWHKWYANGWSDAVSLGGISTSAPAVSLDAGGRGVVFCRGTDGAIWHKWYAGGWSDWHSLGGASISAPAAMLNKDGQLTVLCRSSDRTIHERRYAGGWTAWRSLGLP